MRFVLLVIYLLVIVLWAIISLVVMGLAALFSLPFDRERRAVLATVACESGGRRECGYIDALCHNLQPPIFFRHPTAFLPSFVEV